MKTHILSLPRVGRAHVGDVIHNSGGETTITEILRWREDDMTITEMKTADGGIYTVKDNRPLANHDHIGDDGILGNDE